MSVEIEKNKAKFSLFLIEVLYYLLPLALYLILLLFLFIFSINPFLTNPFSEAALALSTSWIGYSFAAAFFLITLPRNEHLKKLQDRGLLNRYTLIVLSPSIFSSLHLFMASLNNKDPFVACISRYAFVGGFLYAMYSIYILIRILRLHHLKKK